MFPLLFFNSDQRNTSKLQYPIVDPSPNQNSFSDLYWKVELSQLFQFSLFSKSYRLKPSRSQFLVLVLLEVSSRYKRDWIDWIGSQCKIQYSAFLGYFISLWFIWFWCFGVVLRFKCAARPKYTLHGTKTEMSILFWIVFFAPRIYQLFFGTYQVLSRNFH